MRIEVDYDACEGHGMCEAMAPDYFELDDDEQLEVLQPEPVEGETATVKAAVEACPARALRLA